MIDNFRRTIDFLKVPNPFRDVIVVLCGLVALLFFYFNVGFYRFSFLNDALNHISLPGYVGRLELDFLVLVFSFVLGKLLVFIADALDDLLSSIVLVLGDKIYSDKDLSDEELSYKGFKGWFLKHYHIDSGHFSTHPYNIVEVSRVMRKTPEVGAEIERLVYNIMLVRAFTGLFFVASVAISFYYVIPLVAFLLLCRSKQVELISRKSQVARAVLDNMMKSEKRK